MQWPAWYCRSIGSALADPAGRPSRSVESTFITAEFSDEEPKEFAFADD
jgi:hypothetical protein